MSRAVHVLLRWAQRRCKHPSREVVADILQHDNLPTTVLWCGSCGAHAVSEWFDDSRAVPAPVFRRPEPTWA